MISSVNSFGTYNRAEVLIVFVFILVLVYILFGILAGFLVSILIRIFVDIIVDKLTHEIINTFQVKIQKVSHPYVLIHIIHQGNVLMVGKINPCWQFGSRLAVSNQAGCVEIFWKWGI